MTEQAGVRVTVAEGVAQVTLARPQALNAFDQHQRDAMIAALHGVAQNPEARVIVLAGEGRSFCAGQDQKESAGFTEEAAHRRLVTYEAMFQAMRHAPQPIIARVQGHAAGAGFQLALMADLRVLGRSAKMGMTELRIGSPPIVGAAMLLPLLGEARMRELILMADFLDADTALAWGLATQVVEDDDLDTTVDALAKKLAAWDPGPVGRVRGWMRELGDDLFTHAWARARDIHGENFRAGSLTAGARRFLERKGAER